MTNDEIISTLNDLIETSKDGEHGFETCAENVKDMQLKQLFTAAAQRCAEGAKELQEQVRLLGGDPDEHSSVAGTLHRAWVDIKAAITGKDEQAVLEECERGEDVAKKTYEKALGKRLTGQYPVYRSAALSRRSRESRPRAGFAQPVP